MKRIQGLLLNACGYSVAILAVLYLFGAIAGVGDNGISFSRFVLVLAFGGVISIAARILSSKNIKKPVGIIIHYSVLLLTFLVLFVVIGNISTGGSTFTAIVVFTFFYAIIFGLVALINHAVKSADKKFDKKHPVKKKKKSPYKPIYGKDTEK